jgi:hypothetical protein
MSAKRSANDQRPLSATLAISSPTCSLSGKPPFVATVTYKNITSCPIWTLISRFSDFGDGLRIRDPTRNNRRIGPTPSMIQDEWDDYALDLEDTEAIRLGPDETWSRPYTFSTVKKAGGLRNSDTYAMKAGNEYTLDMGTRCRWMYEDEMNGGLSDKERRDLLGKKESVEWKPEHRVNFTVKA